MNDKHKNDDVEVEDQDVVEEDVDGDGDPTVDSRPSAPLQDSRPNASAPAGDGDTGEDLVEGRRNDDLPTEVKKPL
jgi:hypothetical protein